MLFGEREREREREREGPKRRSSEIEKYFKRERFQQEQRVIPDVNTNQHIYASPGQRTGCQEIWVLEEGRNRLVEVGHVDYAKINK